MPASTHYALSDAVSGFLLARESEGATANTLTFYRDRLAHLTFSDLSELTPDTLRRFILEYGKTHNDGGVHALFRTLRAFLNWVEMEELVPNFQNPIDRMKPPKVDKPVICGVTFRDVLTMTRGANLRDRAILLCLFDSGMRAREFLALTHADLDVMTGRIVIHKSKSRRGRVAFLGPLALEAVRAYLDSREDDCPALWLTDDCNRLQYEGLRHVVKRRAKAAGIPSPKLHSFRHGFSTDFIRNGGNVFALQKILGHSNIATTRVYVNLDDGDLMDEHARVTGRRAE